MKRALFVTLALAVSAYAHAVASAPVVRCFPIESSAMEEDITSLAFEQQQNITYVFERFGKDYSVTTDQWPFVIYIDSWLSYASDVRNKGAEPFPGLKRDVIAAKVSESASALGIKVGDVLKAICMPYP